MSFRKALVCASTEDGILATVDHRIALFVVSLPLSKAMLTFPSTSSVNATLDHVVSVLSPLARSLNFTFSAFGEGCNPSSFHITLSARSRLAIEPAPITASDTEAFELIAGTCKHVFGKNTIVSPSGMYGEYRLRTSARSSELMSNGSQHGHEVVLETI